ncbi:hypothetical protein VPH35_076624 [Triticum aestivum]
MFLGESRVTKNETCLFLGLVTKGSLNFTKTHFSFLPYINIALFTLFFRREAGSSFFSNPNTYPLPSSQIPPLFPEGFKYLWTKMASSFFSAPRGTFASLDSEVQ